MGCRRDPDTFIYLSPSVLSGDDSVELDLYFWSHLRDDPDAGEAETNCGNASPVNSE